MRDEPTAAHILSEMDAVLDRLQTLLVSDDPGFAERPPNGKWSIVENLCHLVFAEQLHLHRYLEDPPPWSRHGLPPSGMQTQARFQGLGQPVSRASDVLNEWLRIRQSTRLLRENGSAQVRERLERHLRHLNAHARVIERLFRAQEKAKG